jgi:protein-disulfide isomerase-like protein with CxxC motif
VRDHTLNTLREGKWNTPKITVYHATAPTCWWSWGYEATLNRLALVYGEQIEISLMLGTVYEELDEWMKHYEITNESWKDWAKESAELMGVPIRTDYRSDNEPKTVLPATYAVLAAQKQGRERGARFMRAVLRAFVVEGRDVTRPEALRAAAKEAGLDEKQFTDDLDDDKARKEEYERQGEGFPHLPLGFYNLAISDGEGRTVLLDNAFEPSIVEGAVDYLSGGKLAKKRPTDLVGYLTEHGLAPSIEIARVFGMKANEAEKRLEELRGIRKVEKKLIAAKPHWQARTS